MSVAVGCQVVLIETPGDPKGKVIYKAEKDSCEIAVLRESVHVVEFAIEILGSVLVIGNIAETLE